MKTPGSKRFTQSEKQRYIALWKESGKSKKAFSAEQDIKYGTFVDWTHSARTQRHRIRKVATQTGFVPLTGEVIKPVSSVFAEVYFSGGHKMIFHQEIPATLFTLLLHSC